MIRRDLAGKICSMQHIIAIGQSSIRCENRVSLIFSSKDLPFVLAAIYHPKNERYLVSSPKISLRRTDLVVPSSCLVERMPDVPQRPLVAKQNKMSVEAGGEKEAGVWGRENIVWARPKSKVFKFIVSFSAQEGLSRPPFSSSIKSS